MGAMLHAALCLLPVALLPAPQDAGPAIQPPPTAIRERFELTDFYGQWCDAGGMPVVASARVHPAALREAHFLIMQMLGGRPDILKALGENGVRFTVMAHDQWTTDVPEHAGLAPARFWDRRARGLGPTPSRPSVSCGEENLLAYPGDPYAAENILIHEFAHAIHLMGLTTTTPTFGARLSDAYRSAMEAGRWEGTYAASNPQEYWAEGVQSYFDTNRTNDHDHGEVDTREELLAHDPDLYALCLEVFGADAWRYVHPRQRFGEAHLAEYRPAAAPRFAWPAEMVRLYRNEEAERAVRQEPGETDLAFDLRRAEAGGLASMIRLGVRYRDGRGVDRDPAEALRWFSAAAESGDPEALDHLGWMLEMGLGCEADIPAAIRAYRRAAEGRSHQARFNLGRVLLEGRGPQGPDPLMAAMWLELAAMARHEGAQALLDGMAEDELDGAGRARARRLAKAWR